MVGLLIGKIMIETINRKMNFLVEKFDQVLNRFDWATGFESRKVIEGCYCDAQRLCLYLLTISSAMLYDFYCFNSIETRLIFCVELSVKLASLIKNL